MFEAAVCCGFIFPAVIRWPGSQPLAERITSSGTAGSVADLFHHYLNLPHYRRGHMDPIKEIQANLRTFAQERDWNQFHSPKNLAIALSVEASELLEHFQWLDTDKSERTALPDSTMSDVEKELADVFLYLARLSDRLGVDLLEAARKKMEINAQKYPIALSKGNAVKYSRRDKDD